MRKFFATRSLHRSTISTSSSTFRLFDQLEVRRLFVAHPMQEDAVLNHGPMCPCCGNLNPAATAYFTPTSEMSYVIPGTGEESTQAQVGGRWSSTATNGNTGSQGNPITLTYSFVPDGTPIANGANSSLFSRMRTIFGTNDDSIWQNFLGGAITSWGAQAGITYVREMNDNGGALGGPQNNGQLGVRGDVRIGGNPIDGNSGVLAYNYFPGDGGDMVLDTSDNVLASTSQNRRALYNIVAHEHGHGIGLNHVDPADGTKLMEPFLDTGYFGQQFDDLLGAMVNYNDRLERTGRNDTIGAATNLGAIVTGSTSTTNIAIVRNADTDMFKFTLSESGNFGATVTPTGPTYLQGPQNGTTSSFNAKTQKNLQVSVLNSAGTVLATANATGAGVAESLSGVSLGAGTYYVRVQQQSSDNNTQIYTLGTSFTAASILTASTSTITSPRVAPVDSITITFNNTLQAGTFTMADLTLERDGLIESLAGATLNTSDNQIFTLGNLSGITNKLGAFSLQLDPSVASVVSSTGNALAQGFDTTWLMTGVNGTGSADTITLQNGASGYMQVNIGATSYQTIAGQFSAITIDGGAGADSVEILDNLQNANINFSLVGNSQDSLTIHQTESGVVTANASGVSGNGVKNVTFTSPIASLMVHGTSSIDQLAINGPITYGFKYAGGAGGDSLVLNGVTQTLSSQTFAGTSSLTLLMLGSSNLTFSGLVNLFRLEMLDGRVTLADGGTSTLSVNEMSFGSGTLDLRDNAFVLNYTGLNPFSQVSGAVASGRNGGSWDGTGLTSSLANANNRRIVGYAMANQAAVTAGLFVGQPVDSSTVVARYTIVGDLNLDTAVNFTDLLRMSQNYNAQGLEYASGNVNFDSGGNVDFNDLLIVSQNYGQNLVTAARASSAFASNIRITSETKKRGDGSVATSVLA